MSVRGSSIELYVQSYKDIVSKIGAGFDDPDDDWKGMLIFECEDARHLVPLTFTEEEKDLWTELLIPAAVRKFKPSLVAEVLSAWTVSGGPEDDITSVPPSQHPRRKEVLVLTVFSPDEVQFWIAEIHRSRYQPPKLGVWELHDHDAMSGRFVDPVLRAMKMNEEES